MKYAQAAEFNGFLLDAHPVCEQELMSKLGLIPWDQVQGMPWTFASTSSDGLIGRERITYDSRSGRTWKMLAHAVITASAGCPVVIVANDRQYMDALRDQARNWAITCEVNPKLITASMSHMPARTVDRDGNGNATIIINWLRKGAETDGPYCAHRALGSYWFQYRLVELDTLLQSTPNEQYALARLAEIHPGELLPAARWPVFVDHSVAGLRFSAWLPGGVPVATLEQQILDRVLGSGMLAKAHDSLINEVLKYARVNFGYAGGSLARNVLDPEYTSIREALLGIIARANSAFAVRIDNAIHDSTYSDDIELRILATLPCRCQQWLTLRVTEQAIRRPSLLLLDIASEAAGHLAPVLVEHLGRNTCNSALLLNLQRHVEARYNPATFGVFNE